MIIEKYFPCHPLRQYVHHYWTMKGDIGDQTLSFRDIPDGNIEVLLNFGSSFVKQETHLEAVEHKRGGIKGQFDHPVIIKQTGTVHIVGICFKPYGLYPFLRQSVSSLTNRATSTDLLISDELESKLFEMRDFSCWTDILDRHLLKILDRNHKTNPVLHESVRQLSGSSPTSIKSLSLDLGVSIKSLERLFKEQIGLTPKQFFRVKRIRNVMNVISNQESPDWMKLVVDFGFYDQPHFNKEFLAMTGTSPSNFVQNRDVLSEHYENG